MEVGMFDAAFFFSRFSFSPLHYPWLLSLSSPCCERLMGVRMKSSAVIQPGGVVTKEELVELRLMAGANVSSVAKLLEDCPVLLLSQDEVLLKPGASNQTLYLVLRGRLRVHLGSMTADPIYIVEAGEAVGEISLIGENPVAAYVVADEFTRVLSIDQDVFWSLVYTERAVARNVLWMVAERTRASRSLMTDGIRMREQSRNLNTVDDLTGLHSRSSFEDLLRRQLTRCAMGNKVMSLLVVGINGMRGFVREFGAAAGSEAVCTVAKVLRDRLRPTDIMGYLDEWRFGIMLNECNTAAALRAAKRVCGDVSEYIVTMPDGSLLPPVTVSIGVEGSQTFDKADALIGAAFEALARAQKLDCRVMSSQSH